MKHARTILLDFIQRLELPPAQITEWARPHLENLGNSLLGVIRPNGFPANHQRIVAQYRAGFQRASTGALRDAETRFARAEPVESKEEWITAAEAVRLLRPAFGTYEAR